MFYYEGIDPVVFRIGSFALHWYGVMYLVAFVGCFSLSARHNRLRPLVDAEQLERLFIYVALGVMLGGRVGYTLFYGFDRLLHDPLWLFRIWEGGMSFHGGLLGVALGLVLFARTARVHFGDCLDFVAVSVPIGLFCGRIGNWINQELWGRPSDVPWSVVFSTDPAGLARHPSQLYQAALEGVLLFALMQYYYSKNPPRWMLSAVFACGYGVMRFVAEWFREPDAPVWLWMTRGQLLCLPMIVLGAWWFVSLAHQGKSRSKSSA